MSGGHGHGHAGGAHRWRLQVAFVLDAGSFGVEIATLQVEPDTHTGCKEVTR